MTQHLPLIVDMDGTLLRTDTLAEGLASAIFRRPLAALWALARLPEGRPALKRRIGAMADIDIETLPVRADFVDYLRAQKAEGREIHLVTAADQAVAEQVAARFGLFDSVIGSSGSNNLKSARKAAALRERFPGGYVYAGDSTADLKVWAGAGGVILSGAAPATARRARALGRPEEAEFRDPPAGLKAWGKALRLHQWAKNTLVIAPLLLSGLYVDSGAVLTAIAAFLLLGMVASGAYVLNDLADLSADRRHRTKHERPFASGALSLSAGGIVAALLIAGGMLGAVFLSPAFAAILLTYLIVTFAYSLGLKRVAMLDTFLLAGLFTLRLVMGTVVIGAEFSPWLPTFSMFLFFSLSLAKRHVEVAAAAPGEPIPGRGYRAEDAPITLAFGVASAVASTMILVLYMVEEAFPSGRYSTPEFLWLGLGAVSLWLMRIWLLAQRGELDDDPVAFAVRDRISLGLGALLGLGFIAASVL